MKVRFAKPGLPKAGVLVVGVLEGRTLTAAARQADAKSGGALVRAMKHSRFEGKKDQTLTVMAPAGLGVGRLIALGLGKAAELDGARYETYGGRAVAEIQASGEKDGAIAVDTMPGAPLKPGPAAARAALGVRLRAWRFDKYRTTEKKEDKPAVKEVAILTAQPGPARKAFQPLGAVAEGVLLTRELASEPANVIYPESLATRARQLTRLGVKVQVLGEKAMARLGMNALLGVGQGSARESQLVVMRWLGAKAKNAKPVTVVGKGVTFDSGGISIKPSANMEDMKWDMGGAGVVIGLMRALAGRKAKVNVVGVIGLVENMPSGTAQRPGDVVRSASGKTIEVINTDAEGRLVLADALWYAQSRFKPAAVIDLATLTGAIMIALGAEHAGLFANDDSLADRLTGAGKRVGELLWRMPMGEAYDKLIKSDIADMKNVGDGRAGSITAAQFLGRFIGPGVPWAHLDIAGVTWSKADTALVPKGATAFGVRLLEDFLATHYEGK
ncbi:MAG: leucyl aminopeptidase [Rhodospirillales bacterium]|nr:leucyl aminopeptidase [Rhodospirillales bacterium]